VKRREFIAFLGGAAVAWPLAALAQESAMPVVGYLNGRSRDTDTPFLVAFHRGLNETGYVEGRNVTIEYRWAEGQYDRLPEMAADLVRRQVAVIAANTPAAPVAKAATTKTPIVFLTADDPVENGLVTSLNRPGGNITGVSLISGALGGKQLGLLRELVPAATLVGFLVNPTNPNSQAYVRGVQEAARTLGQQIHILNASTETEIDTAFQGRAAALVVAPDGFFISRSDQLVMLAVHHAVPTMYPFREFTAASGLISYGVSLSDQYRQFGIYTGKILQGAKPADLPVLQPTTFELVINLKTAKMIGLTIPPGVLAIADEVIE
jgi:putative tryptophan/tyrosine transport system substrate-binding protein